MEPNSMATAAVRPAAGSEATPKIEIHGLEHGGADAFRDALARHAAPAANPHDATGAGGKSLGNAMAGRATGLAAEMQKDQQYVSTLLEQATRSGDDLHLMRAMMALSDYQMRVQTISKTVSKAASSIDSLTKLQ